MCYVIFCGGEPYSARGKLHILHRTLRERSLSSHEAQQKEDGGTRYHVKPQAKEIRAMSRKEEKRPINTYAGVLLQYDRCVEYGWYVQYHSIWFKSLMCMHVRRACTEWLVVKQIGTHNWGHDEAVRYYVGVRPQQRPVHASLLRCDFLHTHTKHQFSRMYIMFEYAFARTPIWCSCASMRDWAEHPFCFYFCQERRLWGCLPGRGTLTGSAKYPRAVGTTTLAASGTHTQNITRGLYASAIRLHSK